MPAGQSWFARRTLLLPMNQRVGSLIIIVHERARVDFCVCKGNYNYRIAKVRL